MGIPSETPETIADSSETGTKKSPVRQSVLVVDDEENFLTLIRWFLSQRGYHVVTAANAEEALALLLDKVFDVALLDIKLGSVDGICLLEQFVQRSPKLKVIMMTAYPTVGSIKQAHEKGAIRYLTKPVNLPELVRVIKQLF